MRGGCSISSSPKRSPCTETFVCGLLDYRRMTRSEFLRLLAAGPFGRASLGGIHLQPVAKSTVPGGVTAAVVDFVTTSRFDRIPDNVVVEAKRCLVDGFGVVLAGSTVQGSAIVRDYV